MNSRRQFVQSALLGAAASIAAPSLLPATAAERSGTSDSVADTAPAKTIDWHSHWISPRVVALLKARSSGPRIETGADGTLTLLSSAGPTAKPFPLGPGFTDVDLRLRHLDKTGIDHQIISWATTMGLDAVLSAEEAKPLWGAFNEDLSELVKAHPDRFSGYAVLPTSDIGWAAQELDRAYRELGLIGAVLPVGAFQTLEGAQRLAPLFAVTQRHGGIIYVHSGPASPGIPGQTTLDTPPGDAPAVRYQLEWTSTYARGAVTLTQTGFLDAYPDVTVQVAMLGGATPLLAAWLRLNAPAAGPDPVSLLRRVYFDASTSRAPHTLELAAGTIGADRLLFGSDFPIVPVDRTITAVHQSALGAEDKRRIFVENGRQLFATHAKSPA